MFLLFCVGLILLLCFYNFYYKRKRLPPGPAPFPVVGNLPHLFLARSTEDKLLEWRGKYGPVFTQWFGEQPVVQVADFESMREAFQKDGDAYVDRPLMDEFNDLMKGGNYGLVDSDGDLWREHRRFAIHVLRDFGLGKNLMQDRLLCFSVLDEVGGLLENLKKEAEQCGNNPLYDFDISPHIDASVGSIINYILFGYRFAGENLEEFYALKKLMKKMFESFDNILVLASLSHPKFFLKMPFFKGPLQKMMDSNKALVEFFQKQIDEHKMSIDFENDSAPTDFVEAFMREAKRRDAEGLDHTFSMLQLKQVIGDLWIAGQETTSSTLLWGMYYMVSHPTIQSRLHAELDNVIGSHQRTVTISDKPNLPFTNAVVAEMQRIADLLPQNLMRRTNREVSIGGHVLPKETIVTPQISCLLYDPKLFPNPAAFDPGRFIDENGALKKVDELIPFSIGKRQCLGESLARMELFLFIANIFNTFRLIPSTNSGLERIRRKYGTLSKCPNFKCRIVLRGK